MPSLSSASQSNTVSHIFSVSLLLSPFLPLSLLPSSLLPPSLPPSLSPPSLPPLSDGVGRTGTFICLHSQLERLKTEGVVDFFQAIKSARIQRAGLIPYAVCHKHYLTFPPSLLPSFPPAPSDLPSHFSPLSSPQDQYAYCHEVLADFVNSYGNYANFKEVM